VGALPNAPEVVAVEQVDPALFPRRDEQVGVARHAHAVGEGDRRTRQVAIAVVENSGVVRPEVVTKSQGAVRLLVEAGGRLPERGRRRRSWSHRSWSAVAGGEEDVILAVGYQ